MSFAMTIRTNRDGIFHGVLPAVSQLLDVVNFQVWFAVRFLEKRRGLFAVLADSLGACKNFCNNVRVSLVCDYFPDAQTRHSWSFCQSCASC
ncbi:MAG: hypothetical protein BGO63_15505 [Candidatus Accumulibacter sp. 66-26]|nr:MAG: hypothetical protein BGO63_15505 [Candidatus Accumulibacter sp. 66-26]